MKLSDEDVTDVDVFESSIEIILRDGVEVLILNKADVVELAKQFGITLEDPFPHYWLSCAGSVRKQTEKGYGVQIVWNGTHCSPRSYADTEDGMARHEWKRISESEVTP